MASSSSYALEQYRSPRHPLDGLADVWAPQATHSGTIEFQIITGKEEFAAIRGEWQALQARAGSKFNYFQTFEWNWKWYRHFAAQTEFELTILTARTDGHLSLVWPLMEVREAGLRVLKWLTEPHLQYGDVLVDRGTASAKLLRDAWLHLQSLPGIDLICLGKVLDCANVRPALQTTTVNTYNRSEASQLNLTDYATCADYVNALGRSRRKRHNQRRKKLERLGTTLTHLVHEPGPDYKRAVNIGFVFKKQWLKQSGLPSQAVFQPETGQFVADLKAAALEGALPIASELQLDGKTVAVENGFILQNHYYAYQGAFDWNYRSNSPGKVLIKDMICWCIDAGISHYDMLGTPATYKSEWTDETITMHDHFAARTSLAHLYAQFWLAKLRPAAKNAFENLKPETRRKLVQITGGH